VTAVSERVPGAGSGKITAAHRRRDAVIYVRQSTLAQTQENTESLALQYELRRHAAELGWAEQQITVIDDDLARSAASTSGRLGFTDLVAAVGLGKVGIIVGREVSRLARNNSDWYQVLDLCSVTDTLIADADGIYHPGSFNDRLVLGLKGQMAEAELHMLRMRLTEALRHKAARGELRQLLPVGLDYDDDGTVVLSGDEAVRSAISQVYALFTQLGSARQVMTTLRERGLLLPRRKAGSRRITWAEASYPAVHDLLTNPAYAGAYVFGRTRTEKRLDASGKVVSRDRMLPREEWEVLITGHHPGLSGLGHLAGHPGPAAGQLQAASRGRRRRRPSGSGAPVRADPLRPVRPDDAGRLLRPWRRCAPVSVRARHPAVWHAAMPEHRRRLPAPRRPGPAVPGAGAGVARGYRPRDGRRRAAAPRPGDRVRAGTRAGQVRSRPGDTQARRG
jgi:DNA invertase Pin-like site-specific DNA recombinase